MAMPLEINDININQANHIANHPAYIANRPDTSAIVLHRLSQHDDVEVRMAVADHKNTHIITAMQLAWDSNPDLRYALAENHQLASGVLDILASDENPYVAYRAQKTLLRLKQAIPVAIGLMLSLCPLSV